MSSKTYVILRNDVLGRYMGANKDLKPGELILKESPALIGPQLNGPARCFKCFKPINLLMCSFCEQCNTALMCVDDCKGKYHPEEECLALKTQKMKGQILAENPSVIFPLRCILLSIYNPEVYEKILNLEPHLEKRRDTAIWRRHKLSVEEVLKETNLLTEKDVKEELVQRICGILDINSFEVRPPNNADNPITNPESQCLRAIYPTVAMIAHSCISNTHISVDDNFVMSIYAKVDIKQHQPILTNYSDVLLGNKERQEHLLEGKYFECDCDRCNDPTELGTELSSLVCHKCRKGFLRRVEMEKGFRIWQCCECKLCFKDFLINLAIDEARRRIDDLDPTDIKQMENLFKKLMLTFHPNHYLLLELKQTMVNLYSKLPHSKTNLNRKIDLCGRLLSVLTKLEPGISRIKALTMYELQSALADISHKQYRELEISEEELVKELQTAETILKEAVKYLLYEPPKSPEGRMAQMALHELKMLRNSVRNIEKDLLHSSIETEDDGKKGEVVKRLKEKAESRAKKKEGEENKILIENLAPPNIVSKKGNKKKKGKK
ncbi:SET domain-containing protein SmydA-8-like [Euwallacea similis]|uniref:SET domain-containing protein SmydA-8-like n=1 Tax=Euwallacea similis TaxID=1736056 RepID=UPI003450F4B7